MERNFMRSDSIVELEFLTERETGIHYHENFELLYIMSGEADVTVEEEKYRLSQGDMIVINVNRKHSYHGTEDLFIGRFSISYVKIRELLGQSTILFWCNSAKEKNEAFDTLRSVIAKIFNETLKDGTGRIYLNSLHYQMLHILTGNFLLTAKDIRYENEKNRTDDRMQEIFAYIRTNYQQNITLNDLAEQLYLSPTYLSKYIKRKCNVNFMELINTVRLGHAMEELMYTDESVMKIAMDNGFASVAAYNKAFREAYQMTPSEFRKKRVRSKEGDEKKEREHLLRKKVEEYLKNNPVYDETGTKNSIELEVQASAEPVAEWNNSFCRMINAGTAMNLTRSVFQEQVVAAKRQMGAEYVRFWDIYDPELYIDIHAPKDQMYFGQLDTVLDFLVRNGLKPYIELGFKPLRLMRTTQDMVKAVERDQEFVSAQEMSDFFESLMKHLIKCYGSEEVQGWYFEYWEKEERDHEVSGDSFIPLTGEGHEKYFSRFDIIAGTFRRCLPGVRIGGGGFPLRHYGRKGFSNMLDQWKRHPEKPDFITITCYPYDQIKDGNVYYEKRSTDPDFVLHNLKTAREVMDLSGMAQMELHVSEYSLSLSNRNTVNDSCIKGAFLMQNAISCTGTGDMLGHWLLTDAYSDFQDTQALLFGGCGVFTKSGIPKPGFYALTFLSRLYRNVVAKSRNCLVTGNGRGSFRVVCHNYKNLNYNYYMKEENAIRIKDIPYLSDDREPLKIHLKIDGVRNGSYRIKQNKVNQEYGSIQDEWNELGAERDLNMEEQEYLNRISTPKLAIQEIKVDRNLIELDLVLQPNEIRSLHISYR